jgi:hypothetical protein
LEKIKKAVDNTPERVYNCNWKGGKAMGKKHKKKPIKWQDLAVNALIDLVVGIILILIEHLLR